MSSPRANRGNENHVEGKIVFAAIVVLFTLLAAIWDTRSGKLPNWLTVPSCLMAFVFHTAYSGFGTEGLLNSLGGFAVGFGILFLFFLMGSAGGGDVKLMGAVGAWMGTWPTVLIFGLVVALVAIGSIIVLVYQAFFHGTGYVGKRYIKDAAKGTRKTLTPEEVKTWRQRRRILPYGLFVALGTWLVMAVCWTQILPG